MLKIHSECAQPPQWWISYLCVCLSKCLRFYPSTVHPPCCVCFLQLHALPSLPLFFFFKYFTTHFKLVFTHLLAWAQINIKLLLQKNQAFQWIHCKACVLIMKHKSEEQTSFSLSGANLSSALLSRSIYVAIIFPFVFLCLYLSFWNANHLMEPRSLLTWCWQSFIHSWEQIACPLVAEIQ